MREWVKAGHEVNVLPLTVRWDNQFSKLSDGITRGLPISEPTVIVCGSEKDLPYSFFIKFQNRWFNTKIIMIHWWIPYWNPLLYFVTNISVCRYGQKYLMSRYHIRSSVAYCPVDVEEFRPPEAVVREKKILCIGNNFKNRKIMGYDHLVNIIKKVHEKDPEIRIGVIGRNDHKDYPDYIEVKSLSKSEMLSEISTSTAVFFTTTRNLIMNSMQIAMSCGRPVVAFDLEPFREVIVNGVSGFLIPCFDDDAFSSRLLNIADNGYDEVGSRAREVIEQKCESSKVAAQILSAL